LIRKASISLRLTLWFTAVFVAGFIAFGLAVYWDLAQSLTQGRNRTLATRAARAQEQLQAAQGEPPSLRRLRLAEFSEGTPEGNLIHFVDGSGRSWYPEAPRPADFPWPGIPHRTRERYSETQYAGVPYRVLQRGVTVGGQTEWIFVAGQLEDNRRLLTRFRVGLLAAIPVLVAISALLGSFLSRRALRPVDLITATLQSINIGSLSRRLPLNTTGDELQRLTETCNQMLARLQDAVTRIDRFTADASHELRSPLSLIRGVTELALRCPTLTVEVREALEEILAESIQAASLLEDMLTLARADAGAVDLSMEPVDLRELLLSVCDAVRPLADAKGQKLTVRAGARAAICQGHRTSLRRLLWILLDNSVKYTPPEGRIEAVLEMNEIATSITVSDSGIGIPQSVLPRIFERFFRADPSRSQVEGAGLGLAIARWIADVHRAALHARSEVNKGAEFSFVLPANRQIAPLSEVTAHQVR